MTTKHQSKTLPITPELRMQTHAAIRNLGYGELLTGDIRSKNEDAKAVVEFERQAANLVRRILHSDSGVTDAGIQLTAIGEAAIKRLAQEVEAASGCVEEDEALVMATAAYRYGQANRRIFAAFVREIGFLLDQSDGDRHHH